MDLAGLQWIAQFGFAALIAFVLLRVLVEDVKQQMRDAITAIDKIGVDLRFVLDSSAKIAESNAKLAQQIAEEARKSREDVIKQLGGRYC